MKYFKKNNEVFAYDLDQLDLVKPEMIEMTAQEIKDHLNPPQLPQVLPPLSRRQFKLALLDNGLLEHIDAKIAAIIDPVLKQRIQIEYQESTTFIRDSESVLYMCNLLGLNDLQIDAMWQQALTL